MPKKSYSYSKKITVTTTEAKTTLPRLRSFSLLNVGDDTDAQNVIFEFENPINSDSAILMVGMSVGQYAEYRDVRLKTTTGTTVIYITGTKHDKDLN